MMERTDVRVGRGRPLEGDVIWLDVDQAAETPATNFNARHLAFWFGTRRELLSKHLRYIRDRVID